MSCILTKEYEQPSITYNKTNMKAVLQAILCILSCHLPYQAKAWGKEGHEIVANIAYKHLSSQAKAAVDTILLENTVLNSNHDDDEEETPLGKVANWADKVRFEHEFHWTAPLHYIDIPDDKIPGGCPCCQVKVKDESKSHHSIKDRLIPDALNLRSSTRRLIQTSTCTFVYNRDCISDMCVVGAIYSFSSELAHCAYRITLRDDNNNRCNNYNTTLSSKQSLMFLTHFVGDIHQPLHVSRKTDRGGNTIDVHFPLEEYSMTRLNERDGLMHSTWNLHSIWDEGIIQHAIALYCEHSQYKFQLRIETIIRDNDTGKAWVTCPLGTDISCVSLWAEESWNDALIWAYSNENGLAINNGDTITKEYFHTRLPIIEVRLAAAAIRLAATLEYLFGGSMSESFNVYQ